MNCEILSTLTLQPILSVINSVFSFTISSSQALLILLFAAVLVAVLIFLYFKSTLKILGLQKEVSGYSKLLSLKENDLLRLANLVKERDDEIESLIMLSNLQISNLTKLTEEYKEAKRIAEEADLLKSNFLANMSHEIRTPMNGILGFAQLLQNEDTDKDVQTRYLDIIYHNGTMLINLIDDIMDLAKIEAGQLGLTKSNVNIDDIIFDLYTFFNEVKYKQEKEHITIRILNLNDDENSIYFTDGNRIRQVMSNLISNALKFTEKGTIEFGYTNSKEDRKLKFFVKDSGIGIPEDKIKLIFDRFRQVQEGATRNYGGTGIGLFISKHIVKQLGGDIRVESRIDNGSTFSFELPYDSVSEEDNNTKFFKPIAKKYNWEGKTILVAEDVETNYYLLKTIIDTTNANIIWAKDGEEVLRLYTKHPNVDLVLMDIQMPKLNGYEATIRIKEHNPNIPVIAQTAYAMPNDNIKCIEAGCDDYISKPINTQLLLDKINGNLFKEQKSR
jgi:signal transduction histidine kinase/CheY-like chemotaxis protein